MANVPNDADAPEIRFATPEDAPQVSALLKSFSHTYLVSPTPAEAAAFFEAIGERAVRELIARSDIEYIVAEVARGGAVVGAAAMRHDGVLVHLFVETAHQGRGLGRRMWELLRDRAMRAGHSGPFVVHSSVNAVAVYERFGFVVAGARVERGGGAYVPMVRMPRSSAP